MRISDWSSDVCSSDLEGNDAVVRARRCLRHRTSRRRVPGSSRLAQIRVGWNRQRRSTDPVNLLYLFEVARIHVEIDSASCREGVCQDGLVTVVTILTKKKSNKNVGIFR